MADPSSPLSLFLADAFPGLEPFCCRELERLPRAIRAAPDRSGFVPWATTGTAIDHRLRLAFTQAAIPGRAGAGQRGCSPISTGLIVAAERRTWYRLHADSASGEASAQRWDRIASLGLTLSRRITDTAAALRPELTPDLILPRSEEEELCRLCYSLSWFDELGRLPEDHEHEILTFIGNGGFRDTDEILAVVPRSAVTDMTGLVRLAATSELASLRARSHAAGRVTAGPLFSGSADVGGADGDLIADRTLIDIKATIRPAEHLLPGLRQLLSYLLLDYENEHGIRTIGLYLARQGELVTWSVSDLMRDLLAAAKLAELRLRLMPVVRSG
jgi:hypothetical protein